MTIRILLFTVVLLCLSLSTKAQAYSPIVTTNYNLDAVAEFTPSTLSTGGPIDGSNFVMYSVAYGTLYANATGLPNNGLIASGTRTYQLQPYGNLNTLFILSGQTDSLNFPNPASYAGVSVLGFATEGTGNMNVTIRFTDNTTAVFLSQTIADWFAASPAIISGFDRCNRTTGVPGLAIGQPKMFNLDLLLNCLQRTKNLKSIKFQNTGANPRLCIMAVSGAAALSSSKNVLPVTCVGGTNGSATLIPIGGIPPYSYTISSVPPQFSQVVLNLPVGTYNYTITDVGGCPSGGSLTITQSLVPQPPISVTSNIYTICAGGNSFLGASGANTYTWSTGSTLTIINVTPNITTTYTVAGHTTDNCYRTGSLAIVVNQPPLITGVPIPSVYCVGDPCVAFTVNPAGGVFTGSGVVGTSFCPGNLAPGTYSISYSYTDANTCSNSANMIALVNPLPIVNFSFNPAVYCANSPTVTLNGSPAGGTYIGPGISGSVFSPAMVGVGTASAVYSYTDANGCKASAVSNVTVNALPSLTFSIAKNFYCINAPKITLSASPSGGNYSGLGVTGNQFSPSAAGSGVHNLAYSYTNINGCSATQIVTLTVSDCVGINEIFSSVLQVFPNPGNGNVTIKSDVSLKLSLYNQLGQRLQDLVLSSENENTIKVDNLAEGVYYLSANNNSNRFVAKIVVVK